MPLQMLELWTPLIWNCMHIKFWKISYMILKMAHVDSSFRNWFFIFLHIINELSSCGNFWSQWCASEFGNFWLTVTESEKIYQNHFFTAPLHVMFLGNKSILCFMYSHIHIYKLQDWKFGLITLFHKPDIKNWKQCWKNSFHLWVLLWRIYFLRLAVLCTVLSCSRVDEHRWFRGACCLQFLWRWNESWCICSTASHPRRPLNLFHLTVLDCGFINPLV